MKRRHFLHAMGAALTLYGCGGTSDTADASSMTPSPALPTVAGQDSSAVFAFDAEGNRYEARGARLTRLDATGSPIWSVSGLDRPVAVAVDGQSRVWVLERSQLRIFGSDGSVHGVVGKFRLAQDVVIGADRIYVSEAVGRRVSVLDSEGNFLSAIQHDLLDYPRGLALNGSGELHVVSSARGLVLIFGPDGGLRANYGGGRLTGPRGVAVRRSDGTIAVSDAGNQRIELFSGALNSLGTIAQNRSCSLRFQPDGNLLLGGPDPGLFTGSLTPFASVFKVADNLTAQGQTLQVASFMELFGVLGQKFGGSGNTTFNLPDVPLIPTVSGATASWLTCVEGQPPGDVLGLVGEVRAWPGLAVPPNWIPCDGAILQAEGNLELLQVLGARFGGDGLTTFGVPNLPDPAPGVIYLICAEGIVGTDLFPDDFLLGTFTLYAGPGTLPHFRTLEPEQVLLATADFQPLFTLLSTTYGGNGVTDFALPQPSPLLSNVHWVMPLRGTFPPT